MIHYTLQIFNLYKKPVKVVAVEHILITYIRCLFEFIEQYNDLGHIVDNTIYRQAS